MVLVFKIREGIVGFVVLDSISWQSSSGCFHLCIGTLSLLSPRANFLSLLETAEGHRPFPAFFFNCSKTHKIYHFTAFLFIRLSCCGPGEALSLIVRTLTALSGLPCALPEWASLQPSRTQWLAPVVDPGPTCYNPSLLTHIVQSSNCLMLFLCFHIFGDVLFTACHLTEGRNYFFISSPPSFLSQCSSIAGIEYFGGTGFCQLLMMSLILLVWARFPSPCCPSSTVVKGHYSCLQDQEK